jgi:Tol biopolymer transport system component
MLADLKTGKLSPISELLSKSQAGMAVRPQMSPDRKELLLTWLARGDVAIYAIGLSGGKPIKVASEMEGAWAGNRVALSGPTKEGKVSTIRMVDPATGQSTELPVRGMVVAGLPDGSLLVGGNPKAPTAELSGREALATGRLFRVTADGKVLADLAAMGVVSSPPVVSPGGKYIAFQSKPADAPEGPKTKYSFTILSTNGKGKRELATPYFPLTMTDDGAALVILNVSDPDNMRDVSWITKDGKAVKQAIKAVSAALIGKSVVYATNEGGPAIKTTPLDER